MENELFFNIIVVLNIIVFVAGVYYFIKTDSEG